MWRNLSWAIDTYHRVFGFAPVEVPWIVPRSVMRITCPDDDRIIRASDLGDLVGSAEQSFLALQRDGLPPGRYVACTPCFRNEPVLDDLHRLTFMKVELYQTVDVTDEKLDAMIDAALRVFRWLGAEHLETVPTEEGFDLMLNGVEIGSYGIRRIPGHAWIYGTGLAEPRFTTALNRN